MKKLNFILFFIIVIASYGQTKTTTGGNLKEYRLIDKQTQQPIPYVSVSIEEEDIYRISDEEGFFILPFKNLSGYSVVNFHSSGYKDLQLEVKALESKIEMEENINELAPVYITSISADEIMKKAIKKIGNNYPNNPFNYRRYGQIVINENDTTFFDAEVIAQEYVEGYFQMKKPTRKVEEIRWNRKLQNYQNFRYIEDLYGHRENPVQYAGILNKKKYKKYKLHFSPTLDTLYPNSYIIEFEINTDDWKLSNKGYPTSYFGKIFINKVDYAIIKVEENWEATLKDDEIAEHKKWINTIQTYENIEELETVKVKEVQESYFKKENDGKYYATQFYRKSYFEQATKLQVINNSFSEYNSLLFSHQDEKVQEIPFVKSNADKTKIEELQYRPSFWTSFKKENLLNTRK